MSESTGIHSVPLVVRRRLAYGTALFPACGVYEKHRGVVEVASMPASSRSGFFVAGSHRHAPRDNWALTLVCRLSNLFCLASGRRPLAAADLFFGKCILSRPQTRQQARGIPSGVRALSCTIIVHSRDLFRALVGSLRLEDTFTRTPGHLHSRAQFARKKKIVQNVGGRVGERKGCGKGKLDVVLIVSSLEASENL